MPDFYIHRDLNPESMKGGMLMKSKYRTYGKETAFCSIGNYHRYDNFRHKSAIAAIAVAAIA